MTSSADNYELELFRSKQFADWPEFLDLFRLMSKIHTKSQLSLNDSDSRSKYDQISSHFKFAQTTPVHSFQNRYRRLTNPDMTSSMMTSSNISSSNISSLAKSALKRNFSQKSSQTSTIMTLPPQLSSKSDVKSPLMTSQKSTQTLSSVTSSKLTQFPSQLKINKKKNKKTSTRMTSPSNPSPLIKSHKHSSYATSSTMTSQKHIYPDTHMTSQELSCTMTSQKHPQQSQMTSQELTCTMTSQKHPVEAHMTSQKRQNSVTSSKRPSVTPEDLLEFLKSQKLSPSMTLRQLINYLKSPYLMTSQKQHESKQASSDMTSPASKRVAKKRVLPLDGNQGKNRIKTLTETSQYFDQLEARRKSWRAYFSGGESRHRSRPNAFYKVPNVSSHKMPSSEDMMTSSQSSLVFDPILGSYKKLNHKFPRNNFFPRYRVPVKIISSHKYPPEYLLPSASVQTTSSKLRHHLFTNTGNDNKRD